MYILIYNHIGTYINCCPRYGLCKYMLKKFIYTTYLRTVVRLYNHSCLFFVMKLLYIRFEFSDELYKSRVIVSITSFFLFPFLYLVPFLYFYFISLILLFSLYYSPFFTLTLLLSFFFHFIYFSYNIRISLILLFCYFQFNAD